MKISERDSKILIVIAVLLIGAASWKFIIQPVVTRYNDLNGSLESEIETHNKNVSILERRQEIELSYRRVEATFPADDANRGPYYAFQEDVESAIDELFPGQQKKVDLPLEEPINKSISEYTKLYLAARTSGDFSKITQLLKGFDQKGFLITELSIRQARGIDDPEMTLDLRLDRILKVESDSKNGSNSRSTLARKGNPGGYSR